MPQDLEYINQVHNALKSSLGDAFTTSIETFSTEIQEDEEYARRVFKALKGEIGVGFTTSEESFLDNVLKKKEIQPAVTDSTSGDGQSQLQTANANIASLLPDPAGDDPRSAVDIKEHQRRQALSKQPYFYDKFVKGEQEAIKHEKYEEKKDKWWYIHTGYYKMAHHNIGGKEMFGRYTNWLYEFASPAERKRMGIDKTSQMPGVGGMPADFVNQTKISKAKENKERLENMREGSRENADGSFSTVLLRHEQLGDGTWVVFPSLFQNEDGSWDDRSEEANENWETVYQEALRRGEVFEFGYDLGSAEIFAKGSWKDEMDKKDDVYQFGQTKEDIEKRKALRMEQDPDYQKRQILLSKAEADKQLEKDLKRDKTAQLKIDYLDKQIKKQKDSLIGMSFDEHLKKSDKIHAEIKRLEKQKTLIKEKHKLGGITETEQYLQDQQAIENARGVVGAYGLFSNQDLKDYFGSDIDENFIRNFNTWFDNHKEWKGRFDLHYERGINEETGKFDPLAPPEDLYRSNIFDDAKFKAKILNSYFNENQYRLQHDYDIYERVGLVDKVDENGAIIKKGVLQTLNDNANYREGLLFEYQNLINEGNSLNEDFASGAYTKAANPEMVQRFQDIAKRLQEIEKEDATLGEAYNKMLEKNKDYLEGYKKWIGEWNNLTKWKVNTAAAQDGVGDEYREMITEQIDYNKWAQENPELAMLNDSWKGIANAMMAFGYGVEEAIVGSVGWGVGQLGGKGYEKRALAMVNIIDDFGHEHMEFRTSSETLIDPDTYDINWYRLLPTVLKTATDIYMMAVAGRWTISKLNKMGMGAKGVSQLVKTGGKSGTTYGLKTSQAIGTVVSPAPLVFPHSVQEAQAQGLSPHDAIKYSMQQWMIEGQLERLNPNWKYLKHTTGMTPTKAFAAMINRGKEIMKREAVRGGWETFEEYVQETAAGINNVRWNIMTGSQFHGIPEYGTYKELLLVTPISSMLAGMVGGSNRHMRNAAIQTLANDPKFMDRIKTLRQEDKISQKKYDEIMGQVQSWRAMRTKIGEKYPGLLSIISQSPELEANLIAQMQRKAKIEGEMEGADPTFKKDLAKELEQVEAAIKKISNHALGEQAQRQNFVLQSQKLVAENKYKKAKTPAEKKKIQKELKKIEKEIAKNDKKMPSYSINGKVYDTKKEFLAAIKQAKKDPNFLKTANTKKGQPFKIRIKNDIDAEIKANKLLGKYAKNANPGRVIMTKKAANAAAAFVGNRSLKDLQKALKNEKNEEERSRIQEGIRYLKLKAKGYKFGKKGTLVDIESPKINPVIHKGKHKSFLTAIKDDINDIEKELNKKRLPKGVRKKLKERLAELKGNANKQAAAYKGIISDLNDDILNETDKEKQKELKRTKAEMESKLAAIDAETEEGAKKRKVTVEKIIKYLEKILPGINIALIDDINEWTTLCDTKMKEALADVKDPAQKKKIRDHWTFLKESEGIIMPWNKDTEEYEIYINKDVASVLTVTHEIGHSIVNKLAANWPEGRIAFYKNMAFQFSGLSQEASDQLKIKLEEWKNPKNRTQKLADDIHALSSGIDYRWADSLFKHGLSYIAKKPKSIAEGLDMIHNLDDHDFTLVMDEALAEHLGKVIAVEWAKKYNAGWITKWKNYVVSSIDNIMGNKENKIDWTDSKILASAVEDIATSIIQGKELDITPRDIEEKPGEAVEEAKGRVITDKLVTLQNQIWEIKDPIYSLYDKYMPDSNIGESEIEIPKSYTNIEGVEVFNSKIEVLSEISFFNSRNAKWWIDSNIEESVDNKSWVLFAQKGDFLLAKARIPEISNIKELNKKYNIAKPDGSPINIAYNKVQDLANKIEKAHPMIRADILEDIGGNFIQLQSKPVSSIVQSVAEETFNNNPNVFHKYQHHFYVNDTNYNNARQQLDKINKDAYKTLGYNPYSLDFIDINKQGQEIYKVNYNKLEEPKGRIKIEVERTKEEYARILNTETELSNTKLGLLHLLGENWANAIGADNIIRQYHKEKTITLEELAELTTIAEQVGAKFKEFDRNYSLKEYILSRPDVKRIRELTEKLGFEGVHDLLNSIAEEQVLEEDIFVYRTLNLNTLSKLPSERFKSADNRYYSFTTRPGSWFGAGGYVAKYKIPAGTSIFISSVLDPDEIMISKENFNGQMENMQFESPRDDYFAKELSKEDVNKLFIEDLSDKLTSNIYKNRSISIKELLIQDPVLREYINTITDKELADIPYLGNVVANIGENGTLNLVIGEERIAKAWQNGEVELDILVPPQVRILPHNLAESLAEKAIEDTYDAPKARINPNDKVVMRTVESAPNLNTSDIWSKYFKKNMPIQTYIDSSIPEFLNKNLNPNKSDIINFLSDKIYQDPKARMPENYTPLYSRPINILEELLPKKLEHIDQKTIIKKGQPEKRIDLKSEKAWAARKETETNPNVQYKKEGDKFLMIRPAMPDVEQVIPEKSIHQQVTEILLSQGLNQDELEFMGLLNKEYFVENYLHPIAKFDEKDPTKLLPFSRNTFIQNLKQHDPANVVIKQFGDDMLDRVRKDRPAPESPTLSAKQENALQKVLEDEGYDWQMEADGSYKVSIKKDGKWRSTFFGEEYFTDTSPSFVPLAILLGQDGNYGDNNIAVTNPIVRNRLIEASGIFEHDDGVYTLRLQGKADNESTTLTIKVGEPNFNIVNHIDAANEAVQTISNDLFPTFNTKKPPGIRAFNKKGYSYDLISYIADIEKKGILGSKTDFAYWLANKYKDKSSTFSVIADLDGTTLFGAAIRTLKQKHPNGTIIKIKHGFFILGTQNGTPVRKGKRLFNPGQQHVQTGSIMRSGIFDSELMSNLSDEMLETYDIRAKQKVWMPVEGIAKNWLKQKGNNKNNNIEIARNFFETWEDDLRILLENYNTNNNLQNKLGYNTFEDMYQDFINLFGHIEWGVWRGNTGEIAGISTIDTHGLSVGDKIADLNNLKEAFVKINTLILGHGIPHTDSSLTDELMGTTSFKLLSTPFTNQQTIQELSIPGITDFETSKIPFQTAQTTLSQETGEKLTTTSDVKRNQIQIYVEDHVSITAPYRQKDIIYNELHKHYKGAIGPSVGKEAFESGLAPAPITTISSQYTLEKEGDEIIGNMININTTMSNWSLDNEGMPTRTYQNFLDGISNNILKLEDQLNEKAGIRALPAAQYSNYVAKSQQIPGLSDPIQYGEMAIKLDDALNGGNIIFQGTHVRGEANVLAFIRWTKRKTMDGRTILFIENVQSDWHQNANYSNRIGKETAITTSTGENWFSEYDRAWQNIITKALENIDPTIPALRDQVLHAPENDPIQAITYYLNTSSKRISDKRQFIKEIQSEVRMELWKLLSDEEPYLSQIDPDSYVEEIEKYVTTINGFDNLLRQIYTHENKVSGRLRPNAPYKGTEKWTALAIKALTSQAALDDSIDGVGFLSYEMMMERWGQMGEKVQKVETIKSLPSTASSAQIISQLNDVFYGTNAFIKNTGKMFDELPDIFTEKMPFDFSLDLVMAAGYNLRHEREIVEMAKKLPDNIKQEFMDNFHVLQELVLAEMEETGEAPFSVKLAEMLDKSEEVEGKGITIWDDEGGIKGHQYNVLSTNGSVPGVITIRKEILSKEMIQALDEGLRVEEGAGINIDKIMSYLEENEVDHESILIALTALYNSPSFQDFGGNANVTVGEQTYNNGIRFLQLLAQKLTGKTFWEAPVPWQGSLANHGIYITYNTEDQNLGMVTESQLTEATDPLALNILEEAPHIRIVKSIGNVGFVKNSIKYRLILEAENPLSVIETTNNAENINIPEEQRYTIKITDKNGNVETHSNVTFTQNVSSETNNKTWQQRLTKQIVGDAIKGEAGVPVVTQNPNMWIGGELFETIHNRTMPKVANDLAKLGGTNVENVSLEATPVENIPPTRILINKRMQEHGENELDLVMDDWHFKLLEKQSDDFNKYSELILNLTNSLITSIQNKDLRELEEQINENRLNEELINLYNYLNEIESFEEAAVIMLTAFGAKFENPAEFKEWMMEEMAPLVEEKIQLWNTNTKGSNIELLANFIQEVLHIDGWATPYIVTILNKKNDPSVDPLYLDKDEEYWEIESYTRDYGFAKTFWEDITAYIADAQQTQKLTPEQLDMQAKNNFLMLPMSDKLREVAGQGLPKARIRKDRQFGQRGANTWGFNIAEHDNFKYTPQSLRELEEQAEYLIKKGKQNQILQDISLTAGKQILKKDSDRNNAVINALTLVNHYLDIAEKGGKKGQEAQQKAFDVFESLAVTGTSIGQLLRQYGQLKSSTPRGVLYLVEKQMHDANRKLSDSSKNKLITLTDKWQQAINNEIEIEEKFLANPSKKTLEALQKAKRNTIISKRNFDKQAAKSIPKDIWTMFGTMLKGGLLTPASQVMNIVGNLSMTPLRVPTNYIAGMLDSVFEKIFKTDIGRTNVVLNPYTRGRIAWPGVKSGIRKAGEWFMHGTPSEELAKLDLTSSLKPWTAFMQAIKNEDLPLDENGEVKFSDRWIKKFAIEGVFGQIPETMLRLLPFGDKPFSDAVYYQTLHEQAVIKGLKEGTKAYMVFMQKPDSKTQELASKKAKETVFQEDLLISDLMNLIKTKVGEGAITGSPIEQNTRRALRFFLLEANMPYVKTPMNIIWQGTQYAVPTLAFMNAMFSGAQTKHFLDKSRNTENAALKEKYLLRAASAKRTSMEGIGKGIVGLALGALFRVLYNLGIVSGSEDDPKLRQLQLDGSIGANSFNLSAYKRWVAGGFDSSQLYIPQKGDITFEYTRLTGIGMTWTVQADMIAEDRKQRRIVGGIKEIKGGPGQEEIIPDIKVATEKIDLFQQFLLSASYGLDQSFLVGIANATNALMDPDRNWPTFMRNWQRATSAPFMPNLLAQIHKFGSPHEISTRNRYMDKYGRKKGVWGIAGEVFWERAFWMDSEGKPIKYDSFGNKVPQTPEGHNRLLYTLLNPLKLKQYDADLAAEFIYKLYRADSRDEVVPPLLERPRVNESWKKLIKNYKDIPESFLGESNILKPGSDLTFNQEQYEKYQELAGKYQGEMINKVVESLLSSTNLSLDEIISQDKFPITEPVAKAFQKIYREAREMAKNEILMSLWTGNEELKNRITNENQQKRANTLKLIGLDKYLTSEVFREREIQKSRLP